MVDENTAKLSNFCLTSDTFMDLPGYLENIEHLIKNSFTLKSNEFAYKNVKYDLISYETTFYKPKKIKPWPKYSV